MTPAKQRPPIQFRDVAVERELDARASEASAGIVAARDLGRYYETLTRALATVQLTEPEAFVIVDALNGTIFETHSVSLLWAEIDDACRLSGLDEKWHADRGALVAKLRSLSYVQALAVVDAAERFWSAVGRGEDATTAELVRRVGLVR